MGYIVYIAINMVNKNQRFPMIIRTKLEPIIQPSTCYVSYPRFRIAIKKHEDKRRHLHVRPF
jgi:hypothetical protein